MVYSLIFKIWKNNKVDHCSVVAKIKLIKQNISWQILTVLKFVPGDQEYDVSIYVQNLNSVYSDFETRFEYIWTKVILQ